MLLFVFAFSLIINMFNQSRYTMDVVVFNADKRNFYQHVGSTDVNITRTVGIETIIPTIYTYVTNPDDSIRVNIVDKSGNLLQVFDADIEKIVSEYGNTLESAIPGAKEKNIVDRYNTEGKPYYMFTAPWSGSTEYTINRINAYIYGDKIKVGDSEKRVDYTGSNHNLISLLTTSAKFSESYVEYQKSGRVYWDEASGESLVETKGSNKVIITYQLK